MAGSYLLSSALWAGGKNPEPCASPEGWTGAPGSELPVEDARELPKVARSVA